MILRRVLLAACVPALVWTQGRIDGRLGAYGARDASLYLWSGAQVKRLAPGFEGLLASVYWLRTVQYFGGQRVFARDRDFRLLYPLIDITTTLDPRLEIAYRYGAIFLCEPPPVGAGRPREGIAILERGAKALPQSWRLRQDLGFFYYFFLDDVDTASRILTEAAEIPGAAFWLKNLAADVLAWGGDRARSRVMWQRMFDQAEEGIIKENARIRLRIFDALEVVDRLDEAVAEFRRLEGRPPHGLAELQASGLWNGPRADPTGVEFDYDPSSGRVGISKASTLWRPEHIKK